MSKLSDLIEDLVTANRILATQGIVDSFGHVSIRSPDNPNHYFLSRFLGGEFSHPVQQNVNVDGRGVAQGDGPGPLEV